MGLAMYIILNTILKIKFMKKMIQLDFIKIKNFTWQSSVKRMKREYKPQTQRKYLQKHMW